MKRKIILLCLIAVLTSLALATTASAVSPNEKLEEFRARQETAHQAAELLRELGYGESSAEIQGLQSIWWAAQDEISYWERFEYAGRYKITGYTIDTCGKTPSNPSYGITASGTVAEPWHTLATSAKEFAFGTELYIDGISDNIPMVVEDRGVGVGCIDVCCSTLAECYAITGYYDVYVLSSKRSWQWDKL